MPGGRRLQQGQRCEVWLADAATGERELVHATDGLLLEAPHWTPDGCRLVLNGDGRLWTLDLADRRLEPLPATGLPPVNNDHVLATDGRHLHASADDGHVYRIGLHGGPASRITLDDGWS
ncbi:MAG TPA: biopolymer transporter Tol, partial [Arthrobacter sp.]|nr:biopolymer transporter Tol [Arthrobacter sp.]